MNNSRAVAFAVIPGSHTKELAEGDVRFARIIERKCFGQVLLREHLCLQPIGNRVTELLEHHATGDAGVSLASGGHVRVGVAMSSSKIFLENQIAAAHHQQTAILRASLREIEGLLQPGKFHARQLANRASLF